VSVLQQPVLSLDVSVLQQPVLSLDVSVLQQPVMPLKVSLIQKPQEFPVDMSVLQHPVLPSEMSVLQQLVVSLDMYVLQQLRCLLMYLFYSCFCSTACCRGDSSRDSTDCCKETRQGQLKLLLNRRGSTGCHKTDVRRHHRLL
jgi:hypothetical protein